jgi:hypothetical protein
MAVDLSAIAKWPNVPACYDWLSLDRRGDWRLQGERVTHRGLIEFINRQYGSDDSGCWFVQNGPQRVFVSLACTPWIFRRAGDGFISHTGTALGELAACYLDEAGNVLLAGELGIGLLDDRDLAAFLGECTGPDRQPAGDDELLALLRGEPAAVFWRDIALRPIAAVDVAKRFNFQPTPKAPG